MFQSKGSSSDDRPYEIRMEDIELKESMMVASSDPWAKHQKLLLWNFIKLITVTNRVM